MTGLQRFLRFFFKKIGKLFVNVIYFYYSCVCVCGCVCVGACVPLFVKLIC